MGLRLKAHEHDPEERLLVEAAKRDPSRFAELYHRNFYQIYAYVSRRVSCREDAEDITSEVFQQALAKLATFEWRGTPFAAWLTRIAANAITDRWRRSGKENIIPITDDPVDAGTPGIEDRAALFQLVNELPNDQRRVVFLRFVEQKSVREISEELKRSEGAIKQLQFRALEKLRTKMEGANG